MGEVMQKPILKMVDTSVFCDAGKFQEAYLKMNTERKQKIDRYRFDSDKRLSLGAGLLLQEGLSELGISAYSLSFGKHGKPYLKGQNHLFFNLSHSGTVAVCAFFNREVGVDIQKMKPVSQKLMKKVTSEEEFAYFMTLDEVEQQEKFARLWTVKESYMKYSGTGLSLAPAKLTVTFGESVSITCDGQKANVVFEEHPIKDYQITLCYQRH
ncbi:MAG: 4'-phosphopantetheinyl transferase superfamily protein [Clostridia bacterium]|nr:4'-phosphopantetheinyl transferase superfamily protein [Clostridia bacterium]